MNQKKTQEIEEKNVRIIDIFHGAAGYCSVCSDNNDDDDYFLISICGRK